MTFNLVMALALLFAVREERRRITAHGAIASIKAEGSGSKIDGVQQNPAEVDTISHTSAMGIKQCSTQNKTAMLGQLAENLLFQECKLLAILMSGPGKVRLEEQERMYGVLLRYDIPESCIVVVMYQLSCEPLKYWKYWPQNRISGGSFYDFVRILYEENGGDESENKPFGSVFLAFVGHGNENKLQFYEGGITRKDTFMEEVTKLKKMSERMLIVLNACMSASMFLNDGAQLLSNEGAFFYSLDRAQRMVRDSDNWDTARAMRELRRLDRRYTNMNFVLKTMLWILYNVAKQLKTNATDGDGNGGRFVNATEHMESVDRLRRYIRDPSPEATSEIVPALELNGTVQNKDQSPDVVLWSLDGKTQTQMLIGSKVTIMNATDNHYTVRWHGQVGFVERRHIQAELGTLNGMVVIPCLHPDSLAEDFALTHWFLFDDEATLRRLNEHNFEDWLGELKQLEASILGEHASGSGLGPGLIFLHGIIRLTAPYLKQPNPPQDQLKQNIGGTVMAITSSYPTAVCRGNQLFVAVGQYLLDHREDMDTQTMENMYDKIRDMTLEKWYRSNEQQRQIGLFSIRDPLTGDIHVPKPSRDTEFHFPDGMTMGFGNMVPRMSMAEFFRTSKMNNYIQDEKLRGKRADVCICSIM